MTLFEPTDEPDDRDAARAELAERFANQDATRAGAVDEVAATLDQPTEPNPAVAALYEPPYAPGVVELHVTVHVDPDGLWAEVPGMPGLFATGRTIPELGASLGEAVQLYLVENTTITDTTTEEEA